MVQWLNEFILRAECSSPSAWVGSHPKLPVLCCSMLTTKIQKHQNWFRF